jgi:uncharacterized membrane protein
MPTLYNRIANQSIERLAALSDGIFAVAMTLLVLDLHLPASAAIHSEHGLQAALWTLAPQVLVYLMSFMTLGIFWNGQQTQLNFFERSDRDLSWLQLGFLFTITVMPFTTQLLAHFLAYRTALLIYWLNILLPGLLLYASWRYATRAGLLKAEVPLEVRRAVRRRVVFAQSLYALGALLCILGTRWSIGFILLVQINYAVAPRVPGRSKNA